MARWSVIACVLLAAASQAAGGAFVETYGGSEADTAACVAAAPDGGLVVVGYDGPDGCVLVTKFDHEGTVEWVSHHRFRAEARGAVVTAGYVYVVGRIKISATADWDFLVWKINGDDGTTAWLRRWNNDVSDDVLRDVIIAEDGSLWATGSVQGIGQAGDQKVVIAHLDSGETTLRCAYAGALETRDWDITGAALAEVFDSHGLPWGFAVVGTMHRRLLGDYDIVLTQFTAAPAHYDAHLISDEPAVGPYESEYGTDIVRTTDAELAVSGYVQDHYGNGSAVLVKLGSGLSFEWARIASGGAGHWKRLDSVIETTDREGGIVAVGASEEAGPTAMLATKWSLSGDVVWNRIIVPEEGSILPRSVVEMNDWSLAAAGVTSAWGAGGDDVLLSRHTVQGHSCLREEAPGPAYGSWTPDVTSWTPGNTGTFDAPLADIFAVPLCQAYERDVTSVCRSRTIRVCPSGPADFAAIQDAIDDAWHGDVVELCDAAFTGPGNRDLDFGGKEIVLRSESGNPGECSILPSDGHRGIAFDGLADSWASVEGVHIHGTDLEAVAAVASSPIIRGCWLTECGGAAGAAVSCSAGADMILDGCVIAANASDGVKCQSSNPAIVGCTFAGNDGDGVECLYADPTIDGSILAFNAGRGVYCLMTEPPTSQPLLSCSDTYGNSDGDWVGCIAGQEGLRGNFAADPVFCGPLSPDDPYTLRSDSPCAPDHSPEGCGLIGARPVACEASLIAWWEFDEGMGPIAHDSTVFGNDAAVDNAEWVSGYTGTALRITGNDRVGPVPATFDDPISTAFSVAAWVLWEGPTETNCTVLDARTQESGFHLYITQSAQLGLTMYREGAETTTILSEDTLPVGCWTHVAAVFDGVAGSLRLAIDGQEDAELPYPYPYVPTDDAAYIGASVWETPNLTLNGGVDDLRIYTVALTPEDLAELAGTIRVVEPNGGEEWEAGTRHQIRWESAGFFHHDVRIELYRGEPLRSWEVLFESAENDGVQSWVVTGPPAGQCLVRVSDACNGKPSDTSDAGFAITGCEDCLAWWTFNEYEGEYAYDYTGRGNDALVDGAQWELGGGLSIHSTDYVGPVPAEFDDEVIEALNVDVELSWDGPTASDCSIFTAYGIELYITPDRRPAVRMPQGDSGAFTTLVSHRTLSDTLSIHFISADFDDDLDRLGITVDGVSDDTVHRFPYFNRAWPSTPAVAYIGNRWPPEDEPLNGTLWDLKVRYRLPTAAVADGDSVSGWAHDVSVAVPNPASGATEIGFALPSAGQVRVSVFDVRGRLVRTVCDGFRRAGWQREVWDGKDADGVDVPSGVYFVRAQSGHLAKTVKVVVVR